MKQYVFVYGTLLKGKRNHHILSNSKFIGKGTISGYFMFNLGTYPGIQKSKHDSKVIGEVYEVDETTMKVLDELEEVGYLYNKELIDVNLENKTIKAYVYEYILKEFVEEDTQKTYKY